MTSPPSGSRRITERLPHGMSVGASTISGTVWERVKGLVPQPVPEIVLEPTDMPWGNRSVILRDPDGGLVNLFTPVTPEAKAKYGL